MSALTRLAGALEALEDLGPLRCLRVFSERDHSRVDSLLSEEHVGRFARARSAASQQERCRNPHREHNLCSEFHELFHSSVNLGSTKRAGARSAHPCVVNQVRLMESSCGVGVLGHASARAKLASFRASALSRWWAVWSRGGKKTRSTPAVSSASMQAIRIPSWSPQPSPHVAPAWVGSSPCSTEAGPAWASGEDSETVSAEPAPWTATAATGNVASLPSS